MRLITFLLQPCLLLFTAPLREDSSTFGLLQGEWSRPPVSWTTGREINGTETCGLARTGWVLPDDRNLFVFIFLNNPTPQHTHILTHPNPRSIIMQLLQRVHSLWNKILAKISLQDKIPHFAECFSFSHDNPPPPPV